MEISWKYILQKSVIYKRERRRMWQENLNKTSRLIVIRDIKLECLKDSSMFV